jgi:hypothetical protein
MGEGMVVSHGYNTERTLTVYARLIDLSDAEVMAVRPIDPPRSRSTADAPQPFRITPRVCAMLFGVGRFGNLTADQIARRDEDAHRKTT